MIKILLIGSGAREDAIAKACKKSGHTNEIFCFASNFNPGIMELAKECTIGKINDTSNIADFALKYKVDFAIIGPEAALAAGVTDALEKKGIPTIGPTKELAQIETSKSWARNLLDKYNIDISPEYSICSTMNEAKKMLAKLGDHYVIKADGLKGGKGVKVSGEHLMNHQEALNYCQELIDEKSLFTIEEKLVGEEFSLLSFTDGKNSIHMPPIRDHKRAWPGDLGPNTGGMGSYSLANHLLPFLTQKDVEEAKSYNEKTIAALHQETRGYYQGILYGGYIKTKDGVKLIEYNARFGDPEVINILALLETDFIDICHAIFDQNLPEIKVEFAKKATVCKYIVPEGYPENSVVNGEIDLSLLPNTNNIYFASVNVKDNKIYTGSSRALTVLGVANTIKEAEKIAEDMAGKIKGPVFYRQDIGKL